MPATSAHALARAATILAAQGDEAVAEIGRELRGWLESGGAGDLAGALGVRRDVSRLAGADLEARDALLRAVAAKHFPNPSRNWQADRLHAALERYKAGAWRRSDQWAEANPYEPGSRAGDFWQILQLSIRLPSARTIRKILAVRV